MIVDSEPLHHRGFAEVLRGVGIELTREEYYARYLGYDDHDCFSAVGRERDRAFTQGQIAALTAAKTRLVKRFFATSLRALPGSLELICAASATGLPVAVCSGALRAEVELATRALGVLGCFAAIVAAEDVARGKPDPEGYLRALVLLASVAGRPLEARRCVAIEDSPAGIEAARAAGLKVLAVTSSYRAPALGSANLVRSDLAEVTLAELRELAGPG